MLIKIHPLHYSLIMLIMSIARTLTFLFQSMAFLNGKASILIFMSVTRTPVFLPQSKAFWNGKAFVFPGWRKPLQTVSPTAGSHKGSTSQGGTVQPEHPMPSCFRSNINHVWHSLERILRKRITTTLIMIELIRMCLSNLSYCKTNFINKHVFFN